MEKGTVILEFVTEKMNDEEVNIFLKGLIDIEKLKITNQMLNRDQLAKKFTLFEELYEIVMIIVYRRLKNLYLKSFQDLSISNREIFFLYMNL